MASGAVLKFLEDHNRPFSINDIQSGIKEDFGKSAVQKALDSLVAQEKVKEKVYGKQKVYHVMQNAEGSSSEVRENLLQMDRKINETALHLKEVTEKLKTHTGEFAKIKGTVSLPEALEQKIHMEIELEKVKKQLEKYKDREPVSPTQKKKVLEDYDKYLNLYQKRKRICMDVVNSILENYPKTKQHLFDEIGIETDEEHAFAVEKL